MGKKNRKAIARRKAQPKKKKKRTRQNSERQSDLSPLFDSMISRPSMADIQPPEGFRAIGVAQASMAYAAPLMEFIQEGDINRLNEVMQVGMMIWNYTISLEDKTLLGPSKDEIIQQIRNTLDLEFREVTGLFDRMVERKNHLFPPDIQPESPMIMFIRKEESYQIDPFDYEALTISDESVPPDEEDRALVADLRRMDQYITTGEDYGEWEDFFFSLKDRCCERFSRWLQDKGLAAYSEDFPYCVEVYLDFVYMYAHPVEVTLQKVPTPVIEAFFSDHLLRKVTVDPPEYTHWPPTLKLFYTFLQEKAYLRDAKQAVKRLDAVESRFIDILREMYS